MENIMYSVSQMKSKDEHSLKLVIKFMKTVLANLLNTKLIFKF